MKTSTDFFDAVTRCLITFQHLEHSLKMVLFRLELLTQARLSGYCHYDIWSRLKSQMDAPLGRLIEMFKIYENDKKLITDLRKLKKYRDEVAHQSLVLNIEEMNDAEGLHVKTTELEEWNRIAKELLVRVGARWAKLDDILKEMKVEKSDDEDSEKIPATPSIEEYIKRIEDFYESNEK
ncbi:hypothetical protein [Pelagicoccus sp. SDUM812002]|uniref:hypothetical protein n=1 Tax=Pelagicoccus sp. SDUM812002 TaxID=3041266 RepID=UPI00280EF8AF|nr:hypothetical protein [Pelagicoccus sp. SDUM812002]MDQ8188581.1 hypothetical protein [Pelagicoccus sp. SDUM812002]